MKKIFFLFALGSISFITSCGNKTNSFVEHGPILDLFGSQLTIFIFLIIGAVGYRLLMFFTGEKPDKETGKGCMLFSGGIGLIVCIICFILATCSHILKDDLY